MAKVLMKGNEAIGAAAIKAGCKFFFGYPITPQSELPEYMAREMPKEGATFLQAERSNRNKHGIRRCRAGAKCDLILQPRYKSQTGGDIYSRAELPCVIVNIIRAAPARWNTAGPVGLFPGHQGRRPRYRWWCWPLHRCRNSPT